MMIAVVAFIVLVERGERRIPVQYAKRVVGRRVMGGQSTHMPLKVNAGGVIPVIFASSILAFPQTLAQMPLGQEQHLAERHAAVASGTASRSTTCCSWPASSSSASSTFRSSSTRTKRPTTCASTAGSSRASGPGRNTADYMNNILTKITVVGGIYLAILCLIPDIMISGIHLQHLPLVGNWIDQHFPRFLLDGLNVNFYFGGTSLLIVVGVAMDTINQIEAQLIMRHYEGFTPRSGRIRGRRSYVLSRCGQRRAHW